MFTLNLKCVKILSIITLGSYTSLKWVYSCWTHVSVSTLIRHLYDNHKVFNSKNICWIFENSNTILTQF